MLFLQMHSACKQYIYLNVDLNSGHEDEWWLHSLITSQETFPPLTTDVLHQWL